MAKKSDDVRVYNGSDKPYIFVSYSHADKDKVFNILRKLDKYNYRLWLDEGLNLGDEFARVLYERVANCCAVLVFISDNMYKSNYCKFEVFTAFALHKRICPFIIQDPAPIPPSEFQPIINTSHQILLSDFDGDNINEYIDKLPREAKDALTLSDDGTEIVTGELFSNTVQVPAGVLSIGPAAYKGRTEIRSISLGTELTTIGEEGFRSCGELTSLTVPGQVRVIGDSAFRDCVKLEKIIIEKNPEGKAIEIGERAFENCIQLSEISLPGDLKEIFGGCFNSCKSLRGIKIPKEVTCIGENAFGGCSALVEITVPKNVTKIDDLAFSGCTTLSKIELEDGLLKIGKNAFKDCTSLADISIPSSVTKIGTSPFRGCLSLKRINVADRSKYLKHVDGVLFNKNKSQLICFPANKTIENNAYEVPDSVTEIGEWAFSDCSELESITIPDSVVEIGEGAFYKCKSLKSIVIPDSVLKIDDTLFRGCESLKEVTISDSVIEIGWGIFSGCPDNLVVKCKRNSKIHEYCKTKEMNVELIDAK